MLEKLKEILSKVLPKVDMSKVDENTKLVDDLGFDSLALIMLAMEIEEAFNFEFKDFVNFNTVGEVCAYVEEHKNN